MDGWMQSVYSLSAFPHVSSGGQSTLMKELGKWRERESARLKGMAIKVGSTFVDATSSEPVIDLGVKGGQLAGDVAIFTPFAKAAGNSRSAAEASSVHGRVVCSSGSVACVGYVHAREPVSTVLEALRMDLKRSVKARLDQYVDEAMEFADEHPLMLVRREERVPFTVLFLLSLSSSPPDAPGFFLTREMAIA